MTGPRRFRISKVGAARTTLIVLTFAALEVLCRTGVLDRVTIIPPTEMVTSAWGILRSGRFNADIAFTLFNTAAAIVLATTVGFFAGAIMHVLPRFRRVSEPLLSAYYAIPTFVFYPLLIVTFGVGRVALIVMGAMFGIVAMIVNTMLGLDHVPPAVEKTGINATQDGILAFDAPATVNNQGFIGAQYNFGVDLVAGGLLTNASSGEIKAYFDGLHAEGSIASTVINAGLLYGKYGSGAYLNAGGSVTNSGTGQINGYYFGVKIGEGGTGSVTNAATIITYATLSARNHTTFSSAGVQLAEAAC